MPYFRYTAQASINYVTYMYNQDGQCCRETCSYIMRSEGRDMSAKLAEDRLRAHLEKARQEGGFVYRPAPHHDCRTVFVPWHQVFEVRYMETLLEVVPGVL